MSGPESRLAQEENNRADITAIAGGVEGESSRDHIADDPSAPNLDKSDFSDFEATIKSLNPGTLADWREDIFEDGSIDDDGAFSLMALIDEEAELRFKDLPEDTARAAREKWVSRIKRYESNDDESEEGENMPDDDQPSSRRARISLPSLNVAEKREKVDATFKAAMDKLDAMKSSGASIKAIKAAKRFGAVAGGIFLGVAIKKLADNGVDIDNMPNVIGWIGDGLKYIIGSVNAPYFALGAVANAASARAERKYAPMGDSTENTRTDLRVPFTAGLTVPFMPEASLGSMAGNVTAGWLAVSGVRAVTGAAGERVAKRKATKQAQRSDKKPVTDRASGTEKVANAPAARRRPAREPQSEGTITTDTAPKETDEERIARQVTELFNN